jgi:hypothetical protein
MDTSGDASQQLQQGQVGQVIKQDPAVPLQTTQQGINVAAGSHTGHNQVQPTQFQGQPVQQAGQVGNDSTQAAQQSVSQGAVGQQGETGEPQPTIQAGGVSKATAEPIAGRPAGAKEQEFVSGGDQGFAEVIPVVEVEKPGELTPEVAGWVERAENDQVPEPQTIVHKGQVYATSSTPQQVQITLPIGQAQIKQGLHHKVIDSVRWLAEWCVRIVKRYKGQVGYKQEQVQKNLPLEIKK